MKRVMVRYRVSPERADENERYIRDVFEALARAAPAGVRYSAFTPEDDPSSFIHLVSVETTDGKNPLIALPAFEAFTAEIKARCVEQPVSTTLRQIGHYRLFER